MNRFAPAECIGRDLSTLSWRRRKVRSCFADLIFKPARPRFRKVVARYRPASKCFSGRRRQRRRQSARTSVSMPFVAAHYEIVISVNTHAATHAEKY